MSVAEALKGASNSELADEVARRIAAAKNLDGGEVQALGLFGGRPDGSRPILDAIAAFFSNPAFQAVLLDLLKKLMGGVGASHNPVP